MNILKWWKQYPRGYAEVYADGVCIHKLVGIRKFGTEKDSYGSYDLTFDTIFATTKENGECFHVSFFTYQSIPYCILGSKLVHIIFPTNGSKDSMLQHIENIKTKNTSRVSFAVEMAEYFVNSVYTLSLQQFII